MVREKLIYIVICLLVEMKMKTGNMENKQTLMFLNLDPKFWC